MADAKRYVPEHAADDQGDRLGGGGCNAIQSHGGSRFERR